MTRQRSAHDFRYETTDIPEGMTIDEWRHRRAHDTGERQELGRVATGIRWVQVKLGSFVHRGGGARSGLAAKHGVLRGRQAPPFGSLRES